MPESRRPDDDGEAREQPRFWLYVSLASGAIVGLTAGLLDLSGAGIDDEGLAWLTPLKKLDLLHLSENPITDAGLTHLERLTRLRCVVLRATSVSDEGARKLQEQLPSYAIERSELDSRPAFRNGW